MQITYPEFKRLAEKYTTFVDMYGMNYVIVDNILLCATQEPKEDEF